MNYRQKAKDLVNLATDERTPEKERLNAMVQAVRLIKQHDLLSGPLDGLLNTDNETVRAATTVFSSLTHPDFVGAVKQVAKNFGTRKAPAGGRTTRRR
jgi:hypothetical protein